jgi:hypothetical protein
MRSLIAPAAGLFLSILLASALVSASVQGALTYKDSGYIGVTNASPSLPCIPIAKRASLPHTLLPCGGSVFTVHPNI